MIRVEKSLLPVTALTHPGMKGKNNEDRYGVSAFQLADQDSTNVLLAVLSDGIGGHRAGEVASEIAVETISQYVARSDGKNPPRILLEATQLASQTIQEQAQQNAEQQGMGATCACAWIADNRLYTATVGDSRIYLMRGSQIIQLSIDHTWIQEALDRGIIQPDQVNGHPNAHVIRRYLGSPVLPEVDFRLHLKDGETDHQSISNQGMHLLPGDRLLLCSDGLTDLVKKEEILGTFLTMGQEEAGKALIDLANQRGGHDNITLICIQIPTPQSTLVTPLGKRASLVRSVAVGCVIVVILGLIAGGVMSGWIFSVLPPLGTVSPTATLTLPVQATLPSVAPGSSVRSATPGPPTATLAATTPPGTSSRTSTLTRIPVFTITPWVVNTPTPLLPVVTVRSP